jgi:hypothetical protein
MTLSSSEVRVAGTGELWLAPVATAMPDDTATPMPAAWHGFGYTTEDGVTLSKSVEREGIPAWQSVTPVRYITTGVEFTVGATLLQSNKESIKLWLGSEDFTGTAPEWRADVKVDPPTQQFAMVLEWKDGLIVSRLCVLKAELTETGDMPIARAAQSIPITFGAIAPDSGDILATWLTNDPAFGLALVTGTAGTPGSWAGTPVPADDAAADAAGAVASPTTPWTTGQYVQGSTAGVPGEMYWDGTEWVTGRAA